MRIWNETAKHLTARSQEICRENGCTDEDHKCESYGYITENGLLIDVCAPDYFQGWGQNDIDLQGNYAAIPLPFNGNGQDLKKDFEIYSDEIGHIT